MNILAGRQLLLPSVTLLLAVGLAHCHAPKTSSSQAVLADGRKTMPDIPLDSELPSFVTLLQDGTTQRVKVTFLANGVTGAAFTYSVPGSTKVQILKLRFTTEAQSFANEKQVFSDVAKMAAETNEAKRFAPYFVASAAATVTGPLGDSGDALVKDFVDGPTVEEFETRGPAEKALMAQELDKMYDAYKAAWDYGYCFVDLRTGNIVWDTVNKKLVVVDGLPVVWKPSGWRDSAGGFVEWSFERLLNDPDPDRYARQFAQEKLVARKPSAPTAVPPEVAHQMQELTTPEGRTQMQHELEVASNPPAPEVGTQAQRSEAVERAAQAAAAADDTGAEKNTRDVVGDGAGAASEPKPDAAKRADHAR